MNNEMELRSKLTKAVNAAEDNMVTIRATEILLGLNMEGSKVLREGMKLMAKIDALYEHRMNNLIPEVVRTKKALFVELMK